MIVEKCISRGYMDKSKVLELIRELHRIDHFSGNAGLEIVDVGRGFCKGKIRVSELHLNPLQTVHGGVMYTMADTISGLAAATAGNPGPTVSGDMYFMRPATGCTEIYCESRIIKRGSHINVVEASILNDKGEELARAVMQYMPLYRDDASSEAFILPDLTIEK